MVEINLVPDVKQELLKAQRLRATVVSVSIVTSIIALGLVAVLLVYVYGVQFGRNVYLDGQIKNKAAELAQVEDLSEMVTIQNQLGTINSLHENKTITSRAFDMLAAVLPPAPNKVNVSQVDVNIESKTIRLEGQTGAFNSMEVFKKTVESAVLDLPLSDEGEAHTVSLASNIDISDISYGESAEGERVVRFIMSFVYADELFSAKVSGMSFKLRVNGNVTDSYLGLPRSLFVAPVKSVEGKGQ